MTGDMWVTCFQDSAEMLLGETADNLGALKESQASGFAFSADMFYLMILFCFTASGFAFIFVDQLVALIQRSNSLLFVVGMAGSSLSVGLLPCYPVLSWPRPPS